MAWKLAYNNNNNTRLGWQGDPLGIVQEMEICPYEQMVNAQPSVIYSHNKYAYIHIYMFMQDTYRRNKLIRRSNKRRGKTSLTNIWLSLYL